MPFVGEVNIAFLPQERMTGFGSLVRLVESMAMGPQLQERLTDGLAAEVMRQLEPAWVAVSISAIQTCVEMSGTGRRPRTVTMSTLGATTPETAWPFVQHRPLPETGA
jgi:GTP cyclohydrolase I